MATAADDCTQTTSDARARKQTILMHTRTLGGQGLRTSAIGLGTGSTTTSFGERDAEVQVASMRRALDLEVNFPDSSDAYPRPSE
jgi:aryl-alcohol dehydrogenase-like predicted oxidoreductase